MNKTLETILTRKSVRKFTDQKVDKKTIELLLQAAMSAPSNVNKQPWEFVVIDDKAMLQRIASMTLYAKMTADAPVAILVCGNMEKTLYGEGKDFWVQDCSAASENILLAAHALGLGAVWTGVYPTPDRVRNVSRAAGIPTDCGIIPLSLIPIGYPADEESESQEPKAFDPSIVHYNGYTK